jgi:hypothetical protein
MRGHSFGCELSRAPLPTAFSSVERAPTRAIREGLQIRLSHSAVGGRRVSGLTARRWRFSAVVRPRRAPAGGGVRIARCQDWPFAGSECIAHSERASYSAFWAIAPAQALQGGSIPGSRTGPPGMRYCSRRTEGWRPLPARKSQRQAVRTGQLRLHFAKTPSLVFLFQRPVSFSSHDLRPKERLLVMRRGVRAGVVRLGWRWFLFVFA